MPRPPPAYVERPRLLELLDASVARSTLTIVRAPAGMGKTALVSAWAGAGRAPGPVAWLSLAPGDDTRSRFWRQVVLAMAEAAGDGDFPVAFSSSASIDGLLVGVVDALSHRAQPIVLVLDDVHELTDPALIADLDRLLRAPPAGLRIVATSRSDLPVHVSRLRLSGTLAEIGAKDLAFTFDEAVALFAAWGLRLSEQDVRGLWQRTEGWGAGLALTALALQGSDDPAGFVQAFSGEMAPVADYLLEEVVEDESPEVRRFLLMTSVVDEVCGGLADAMTGQSGGGAVLADLHQRGVLTTALDDHQEWYRYHGLLAGMLRIALRREQPRLPAELHARAARWLADHGRVVPGARHAAAAEDLDLLADIAAGHAFALSARGELGDLGAVIATMGEEELMAYPTLLLTLAGSAMEAGDAPTASVWLQRAEQESQSVPARRRASFETGLALARLYEARLHGDVAAAVEGARPFLTPQARARVRGPEVESVVLIQLGALEMWTGDLDKALEHLTDGIAVSEQLDQAYLTVYGLALLGVARSWVQQLDDAAKAATRALELAQQHGWQTTARAGLALMVLSYVAMEAGDLERADELRVEADSALRSGVELPLLGQSVLPRARLLRTVGHPREAVDEIAGARAALEGTPFLEPIEPYLLEQEALALRDLGEPERAVALLEDGLDRYDEGGELSVALALVHIEAGRDEQALDLARPWADPDASTMLNVRLNALLVQARAQYRLDDPEWRTAMEQALALAEQHDRRGPFHDHGPDLAEVLSAHRRAGTAHGAFAASLGSLGGPPSAPAAGRSRNGAAPVHGVPAPESELSERELAVLRYLPTRMSNREIADELIVSVNTVKTHVRSIYGKLGAHDRRSAVEQAQRLGLLRGS